MRNFLKINFFILMALVSYKMELAAQNVSFGPISSPEVGIRVNSVQNMFANGDTVWVGPIMNSNIGNTINWRIPEGADSLVTGRGRMFSINATGKNVLAGVATNVQVRGESVATAMGFYYSEDGGEQWNWIAHPLESEDDTTFTYGNEVYTKLPVIVPEQSPSYEVEIFGNVFFSANWATGILRSMDKGQSWERLILPPVNVSDMQPGERFQFYSPSGNANQPESPKEYDPRPNNSLSNNYLGYSVLVDKRGRLWAGTAGGFNISDNAITADRSQIRWQHYAFNLNPGKMIGSWVITIQEDVQNEQVWMTNWSTSTSERDGVLQVDLDLTTFKKHLVGERIYDISIKGDTVLAVGDNGLFISPDYGKTWINRKQITSPNSFIRSEARFQSTAVTNEGTMWVGTSDGIATTKDFLSWNIIRTDVPLSGETVYQEQPSVSSYAYPNPFSQNVHQIVRVKFEVQNSQNGQIRIFDAAMRLISQDNLQFGAPGSYEAVWDGKDQNGYTVSNGIYLYAVEVDGKTLKGKIVVAQ